MPPTLDLSGSTHAKVMVAPSRLNLRRAGSYNPQDRGPLSATSSRFNFNHLLFSPPPSPRLPSLVPRPKPTPTQLLKTRPSRVIRYFVYMVGSLCFFYILGSFVKDKDVVPARWPYFSTEEFEMVSQYDFPDFPTPIVVSDSSGSSKWTVSIPPAYDFPLTIQEYSDMSGQCREVSARARDLHHKQPLTEQTLLRYDAPDSYYVDIEEAEQTGLLPKTAQALHDATSGIDHFVGLTTDNMAGKPFCSTSMTYVLESDDAGLGSALMMMWTFYGLAKAEGRTFFIDDSRWAYGPYSNIVQTPVAPDCRPPPRHHMVPCPFQAKHLVVSSATAREVFPGLLAKHHRKAGLRGETQDLFKLARTGYEALFGLLADDQEYVAQRIAELREKSQPKQHGEPVTPLIGVHVRRGDQHPLESQYQTTYMPNEVYQEAAERLARSFLKGKDAEEEVIDFVTVLASDDPTVPNEPEFYSAVLAQERIRLISKEHPQPNFEEASPVMRTFEDQSFGWEGGFYAAMFWNVGLKRKNNAGAGPTGAVMGKDGHVPMASERIIQLRNMVARGYLLDLAVLAGASDGVVCTVSAIGCRLLGVMMGWENGVNNGRWVNIDGDYGWTGIKWQQPSAVKFD